MKAMLLHAPRPIADRPLVRAELPVPVPGPGDLLVRVEWCGVCHTDLHEAEGDIALPDRPRVPGHQIVGTVADRAPGVTRFAVGERIGIAWLHRTCGTCEFCGAGSENLCRAARFTGLDVHGGYAEFATVPEAFAYRIPAEFPDEQAAPLLCGGIIGYRALRLSGIRPGQRLGLYGFGASAHIAIQIARHWDCEVFVFTRSEEHRALARDLGAAWTGDARDDPPALVHASVVFAPAGRLVLEALRVLERGGTVALAGIHMSVIPPIKYDRLLYHERGIRSVANATRRDGEELLALAARIPVRTTTCRFDLADANDALLALKSGQINGAAVLQVS
jgi:propanol-preferring alcohol dehydrogenase